MKYAINRSIRKSLVIKITQDGKVKVLAPIKCTDRFIDDFVKSKERWIEEKLQNIKDTSVARREYFDLEKFIIFGDYYDVGDKGDYYGVGGYQIKKLKGKTMKECFIKFSQKQAEEYLPARTAHIANVLGYEYTDLKIISARKKWGSCNDKKQLRLNFRLIMLPKYLIDYVICHELCHTKIMNHSKDFWDLLKKIGYKKAEIKEKFRPYGFILQML